MSGWEDWAMATLLGLIVVGGLGLLVLTAAATLWDWSP